MKNSLTGSGTIINYKPISAGIYLFLRGNCFRNKEEMAYLLPVLYCAILDVRNMFSGDNKNVDRGLGINILECNGELILMNNLGRDFFFDDFAE